MSKLALWLVSAALVALVGCHGDDETADEPRLAARAEPRRVPQVQPPIDVKEPPKDAGKTGSGLSYKRLIDKPGGLQARPGESVLIRYTGWRQRTGETFFTTGVDGQSITVNPAYAAPAFREVIPLLHKGRADHGVGAGRRRHAGAGGLRSRAGRCRPVGGAKLFGVALIRSSHDPPQRPPPRNASIARTNASGSS